VHFNTKNFFPVVVIIVAVYCSLQFTQQYFLKKVDLLDACNNVPVTVI